MLTMKYIHKIEIEGKTEEQKQAIGWNDPDKDNQDSEDYEVIIFLDGFSFRKNQNIVKAALMINYIFMIELVCATARVEGVHAGEKVWCGHESCPPVKIVEKMGFHYGYREK